MDLLLDHISLLPDFSTLLHDDMLSLLLSIPVLSPCFRPIPIAWYPVCFYTLVFLDDISARFLSASRV